jgi:anti-sigma B factor antagonist
VTSEQLTDITLNPRIASASVARLSYPQPDVTVCTVIGDVDMVTQPALAKKLIEAVGDDNRSLVIDLSEVAFFGSTGLHTLVEIRDRHDSDGHLAVVVDSNARAARPLQVTGLDKVFDLHLELGSALRACRRPPRSPRPAPARPEQPG